MSAAISDYVAASLGEKRLSLLVKDSKLLNVYTGETYKSSIGVYRGRVVLLDADPSRARADFTIDADGMVAIPGLIDTHLHVESSMVTPSWFAQAVLPHGLTTAFADPHEIANVLGKEGVRMMVEDARGSPLRLRFFVPTCVPESSAVTSGAEILPEDVDQMLGWEGISGLGELMDFAGVLSRSPKMMDILEIGRKHGAVVDGHSPLLGGRELNAYVASGPEADHENFSVGTTVEKMRLGMYVKLRGPYLLDTKAFVSTIESLPRPWGLIFCTDDVMPDNLLTLGHLDYVARSFIQAGMDPVEVVRSVTLRPAQHMRAFDLGAIAPGKAADIVLLKDLRKFEVHTTIAGGRLVAREGKLLVRIARRPFDRRATNSVHLHPLSRSDMNVRPPVRNGSVEVNLLDFNRFRDPTSDPGATFLEMALTQLGRGTLTARGGVLELGDVSLVLVFERHTGRGRRTFGFARNLVSHGGIASTVAHDAHNLVVVGTDLEDMRAAANLVIGTQGGLAAVKDGRTLAQIALPIAGLMAETRLEDVARPMLKLRKAFRTMGVLDHPYMPLPCLITLSVIPHARITDRGTFDVDRQAFVEPFVSSKKR